MEEPARRESSMAMTRATITNGQREPDAIEDLRTFDKSGVTSTGSTPLDLVAPDAQVFLANA